MESLFEWFNQVRDLHTRGAGFLSFNGRMTDGLLTASRFGRLGARLGARLLA